MSDDALVETLRKHYGEAARRAAQEATAGGEAEPAAAGAASCSPAVAACCGSSVEAPSAVFGSGVYGPDELDGLPAGAVAGSIGCANPVALARLEEGEVVLDLGSGGGIDVLLSARRVGPTGRAYGLDMTAEMLELARANQARAGVANAEFLEGRIEAVPLPDASVDVVVSNCVINLSADKRAVFAEAFRVLRPGGRLAVADVVADTEPDEALRADVTAWASCIAGAVTRAGYAAGLADAGFVDVEITDSHAVEEGFWSVFVRARKP
ncbi:MAG TPA: arsenite methyltransferase [Acidimicrobiales bacterium]|nr:arsenite methyltransferase [Acidimicrobiales bacterium]